MNAAAVVSPSRPDVDPANKEQEASDDEDEEEVAPGWRIVRTADNQTYYWNEETNETSWELPSAGKVFGYFVDISRYTV